MIPTSFNRNWGVRPRTSTFFGLGGTPFESVTLPHDALIGVERSAGTPEGANSGFFPSIDVEYEKAFDVPKDAAAMRHVLEFEGVYRDARVYVNGALAAHRPYGYSRFFVQLDPFLRYGESNLVRVEATSDQDSRWYTGAGIIRPVTLHTGGLLHVAVEGPRFSTPQIAADLAVVQIDAQLCNESPVRRTVRVLTEVIDNETGDIVASGTAPVTVFPGEAADIVRRLFVRGPRLWGPDTPNLYRGRIVLMDGEDAIDEVSDTFGIRKLELDPVHGLRINGLPIKLRGACVHHDNGPIGAATIDAADDRRIRLLREAGFNAIRSAHNPASTALLRACDRYGMIVMDETFDVWTSRKARFDYAQHFADWWERDVESIVKRGINRPSVAFYSIGNEIPEMGNSLSADLGRDIANKIKHLDPTRFTVNAGQVILAISGVTEEAMTDQNVGVNDILSSMDDALDKFWQSPVASRVMEESFSQVDVAGYNYGHARYQLDPTEFPDRIVVGSETSRRSIARNWSTVLASPHIIGDFCWTGWDYIGEVGAGRVRPAVEGGFVTFLGSFPYLTAETGDIDITGTRRPASFFRETVFGLRATPYIAVQRPELHGIELAWNSFSWRGMEGTWTWPGREGKPVTIEVYSAADEVELFRNGHSVGRAPAGASNGFMAEFETTYEPGTIVAVAFSGGRESGRSELTTAGPAQSLAVTAENGYIDHTDASLAFVRIRLVDFKGRLNTAEVRAVTVTVEGPGVLQGLGTGDTRPDEQLTGAVRSTHAGELLAVVRPTAVGTITVTATAEGVGDATIELISG